MTDAKTIAIGADDVVVDFTGVYCFTIEVNDGCTITTGEYSTVKASEGDTIPICPQGQCGHETFKDFIEDK